MCVNLQTENNIAAPLLQDTSMLDTSPSSTLASNMLNPGEVIRTSGKFGKPTKIPGKNYSKDEVVIRNADSGKGMICFVIPLFFSHLLKKEAK